MVIGRWVTCTSWLPDAWAETAPPDTGSAAEPARPETTLNFETGEGAVQRAGA